MTWEEIKQRWFWHVTLSHWFAIYFFGTAFAWTGAIVMFEHRVHGGTYEQAYLVAFERADKIGLTNSGIIITVLFWAALLWLYSSGSATGSPMMTSGSLDGGWQHRL
jgi:hypothetical protein